MIFWVFPELYLSITSHLFSMTLLLNFWHTIYIQSPENIILDIRPVVSRRIIGMFARSSRADLEIKIDVWQSFKFLNKAF